MSTNITGQITGTFTGTISGPVNPPPPPPSQAQAIITPSNQTVQSGQTVTLNGSASTNASVYSWMQTSGPTVILNVGANSAIATFVAPASNAVLTFILTVS